MNPRDKKIVLWLILAVIVILTVVTIVRYQVHHPLEVFIKAPGAERISCQVGMVSRTSIQADDVDAKWTSVWWTEMLCRHIDGGYSCKIHYDATKERPRFQCMVMETDKPIRFLCNRKDQLKPGEIFRVSEDLSFAKNSVGDVNCQVQ